MGYDAWNKAMNAFWAQRSLHSFKYDYIDGGVGTKWLRKDLRFNDFSAFSGHGNAQLQIAAATPTLHYQVSSPGI